MDESEVKKQATNLALKILASYLVSIAALIFSVVTALVAARELGADKDLIRKMNMGTPVIAIGLSLLVHFLTKHAIVKALTISISILFFCFTAALVTQFL